MLTPIVTQHSRSSQFGNKQQSHLHHDPIPNEVQRQIYFCHIDALDHDGSMTIDLSGAKLWGITVVAALEKVSDQFRRHDLAVAVNPAEVRVHDRLKASRPWNQLIVTC